MMQKKFSVIHTKGLHVKKNIDIEFLRSIAIIFVIYAHLYNLFPWGQLTILSTYKYFDLWTGVDLFFCVSGYIITSSVMKTAPENRTLISAARFSIPFWIKRAWRLWPSAWVFLSLTTILSVIFSSSGIWGRPFENITYQIYAMLHMANFYGFECKINGTCGANQVYWSLSLEEQFYFLFPLIIFIFKKKHLPYVFLFIFLVQFPLDRGGSILGFIRSDAISLGALIAILQQKRTFGILTPESMCKKRISIPVIIGLLLSLVILGNSRITIVPFSTGLVAVVSGVLVWLASFNNNYLTPFKFMRNISLYLGARSYSLYLAHIPAFFLTKEIFWRIQGGMHGLNESYTLRYAVVGLIILMTLTEFNYRIIENPLRLKGRKIATTKEELLNK